MQIILQRQETLNLKSTQCILAGKMDVNSLKLSMPHLRDVFFLFQDQNYIIFLNQLLDSLCSQHASAKQQDINFL